MSNPTETVIPAISSQLREWIHDMNNALFVTKGFLEEVESDVSSQSYRKNSFDHENFLDMINTVSKNVEKLDHKIQSLRKFASEDIFEQAGLPSPK